MQITDFTDSQGRVDIVTVDTNAIGLTRNARVSNEDLARIRRDLRANAPSAKVLEIALANLGGFLKYANQCLTSAERGTKAYYDRAYSEIAFAGSTFVFRREA